MFINYKFDKMVAEVPQLRDYGGPKSGILDSNQQPHGPKPCALANCANPRLLSMFVLGIQTSAAGGNRTHTLLRGQDFKSCVYTNFTTAAIL